VIESGRVVEHSAFKIELVVQAQNKVLAVVRFHDKVTILGDVVPLVQDRPAFVVHARVVVLFHPFHGGVKH